MFPIFNKSYFHPNSTENSHRGVIFRLKIFFRLSRCTCYPRRKPLIEGNADGLPAFPVTAVGRLCFPWLELCVSVHYFIPSASPSGAFSCPTMKSNKQEECRRMSTCSGGREGGQHTQVQVTRSTQLSVTADVEEELRSVGTGL